MGSMTSAIGIRTLIWRNMVDWPYSGIPNSVKPTADWSVARARRSQQ